MSGDKVSVLISKSLYDTIKRNIELSQGHFNSVEEYVEFVLNEVADEKEEHEQAISPEEEENVKERLRRLGYL